MLFFKFLGSQLDLLYAAGTPGVDGSFTVRNMVRNQ
jgi:hypothetical protein